jgi:Flp pilus assembly protein TadG
MVTAELATIIPFGVALTILLLWVVSLGLTQVRVTDAAREGARLVARGESVDTATRAARRDAPDGSTVSVDVSDGVATVTVRVESAMPVPFFSGVGARPVEADASAVVESP